MTTFGIVMFIYYCLNIVVSFFYIGRGTGPEYTTGTLVFGIFVYTAFLLSLLYFGTGLGVL